MSLHHILEKKIKWYKKWHMHWYAQFVHYTIFVLMVMYNFYLALEIQKYISLY